MSTWTFPDRFRIHHLEPAFGESFYIVDFDVSQKTGACGVDKNRQTVRGEKDVVLATLFGHVKRVRMPATAHAVRAGHREPQLPPVHSLGGDELFDFRASGVRDVDLHGPAQGVPILMGFPSRP